MAGAAVFHSAPMEQNEACTQGELGKHQAKTMGDILPFHWQKGRAQQHPCQSKQEKQCVQAQDKKLFQGRLPPFMRCR